MAGRLTLGALNAMPAVEFVAALAEVFEHSPWVAGAVVAKRPFSTVAALHRAMCDAVLQSGGARQLALVCAHPELGGGAGATPGALSAASAREQCGVGLDTCGAAPLTAMRQRNRDYRARFGFPFVIAVRGRSMAQIADICAHRLRNEARDELDLSLAEIFLIAQFRLADLIAD